MKNRLFVSLLAVSVLPGLAAGAQSLATIAQAGKRSSRGAGRVFTDADLIAVRGHSGAVEAPEGEALAVPLAGIPDLGFGAIDTPGASAPAPLDERAQRRNDLQRQLDGQLKVMDAVRKAVAEAQNELNDMSTLLYGPGRRAHLVKLVEDGLAELARGELAIAELDEQARRDGFVLSR
jgi:hypothetical protein